MGLNNLVNNAKPYFFRLDIAKEAARYARFTDWLKTRVSDNGKKVPVKWYDQGQVMNVHGFTPFIKGGVGHYSIDEDDNLIPASDVVYRDWQGTPADVTDDGVVYYTLEDQFFCKEGLFKGMFGLRDNKGNVYSSVNIVFEILGDDLRIGQTTKYYISELDKIINNFKIQTQQAIDDARKQYNDEIRTTRDSLGALQTQIQTNRDEQTYIASKLNDVNKSYQNANSLVNAAIDKLMSGKRINITAGYDLNNLHNNVGYANGVVPAHAPNGVSAWAYYVALGENPIEQFAIETSNPVRIWGRSFSGASPTWGSWSLISGTTTYSNSDIQNMINSHTRGKVSVGYDVENDRVITTEQAYDERELVDRNVATSMGNVIRSIKGEGNYIRNDAVDLHKLFGDGVGITTYVCRNKGTLDVPSYYSDKRGTLIVLNFDNNAFTQIWFPVGTSGKGYNGGDPSCAMRYGEQTGTWTPWAILQTEVKHGGQ